MAGSVDPITTITVIVAFAIVVLGLISIYLRVPTIITYILTGILLGPYALNLLNNTELFELLGTVGVILLLFFLGMEMSVKRLLKNWKIAIGGGILEVLLGLVLVGILGYFLNWPIGLIVVIAFVITLSSTAVIIKLLQSRGELKTKVGQSVLSVLIMEDILVVPMLLIVSFLGGDQVSSKEVLLQILGGILIIGLLGWALVKGNIKIPFMKRFRKNEEVLVFLSLALCFGLAFVTGLFGLSTALGAFVAGILIAITDEKKWIEQNLKPIYIIFLAFFFISIGLIFDIPFFLENWKIVSFLVVIVLIINTLINTFALKLLGLKFKESFYAAIILSQIGEFSFVLATAALQVGTISEAGHNLAISVITTTLILTPFLAFIAGKLVDAERLHDEGGRETL